jgi:hypothetical protein
MKKAGATIIDPLTDPPVHEALHAKDILPDFTYRSAKPDAFTLTAGQYDGKRVYLDLGGMYNIAEV